MPPPALHAGRSGRRWPMASAVRTNHYAAEAFGRTPFRAEDAMLDRSTVVDRLTTWVGELVPDRDVDAVGEDSDLGLVAGFDSVALLQLLARAEDDFDVSLSDRDDVIRDARSIGSLADQIVRIAAE
ncbi:acyl carrier protein [Saccharopolyspora sp. ASAGF58]|nr:acyl carrier protein [Saccharopolyspora sp. ASAGF58]